MAPVSSETVRDWLLRQVNPAETDAALCRSLTSTLGVTAKPQTEYRFPADGPAYPVVNGCEFEVADPGNVPAAISRLEQALTPATAEDCEGWLVLLQAATAHRTDSEVSSAVAYSLYAAELRRWPADVAKAACERLARGKPGQTGPSWFPTLAEVVSECERLATPRKAMLYALKRWEPPAKPHVNDRRFGEPSEADKAAVKRMAEEARASLVEAAAKMRPKGRFAQPMPSTAGRPAEGSHLTPEMLAALGREQ